MVGDVGANVGDAVGANVGATVGGGGTVSYTALLQPPPTGVDRPVVEVV